MLNLIASVFLLATLPQLCLIEPPEKGQKAPTSVVATFLSGAWVDEQRDACPVLIHRDETRIAIFAKDSGDAVMKLADRMDAIVADHEQLKSSFLFVSHENQPTPSEEEWAGQLQSLKQQVAKYEIQHLAAGLMIRLPDPNAVTRARRQVGVFQNGDVVVMLIVPQKGTFGIVKEAASLKSAELTDEQLEKVTALMKTAVESVSAETQPVKAPKANAEPKS